MVEHLLCKQGVVGSIPFTSTRFFEGFAEFGEFERFGFFEYRISENLE